MFRCALPWPPLHSAAELLTRALIASPVGQRGCLPPLVATLQLEEQPSEEQGEPRSCSSFNGPTNLFLSFALRCSLLCCSAVPPGEATLPKEAACVQVCNNVGTPRSSGLCFCFPEKQNKTKTSKVSFKLFCNAVRCAASGASGYYCLRLDFSKSRVPAQKEVHCNSVISHVVLRCKPLWSLLDAAAAAALARQRCARLQMQFPVLTVGGLRSGCGTPSRDTARQRRRGAAPPLPRRRRDAHLSA